MTAPDDHGPRRWWKPAHLVAPLGRYVRSQRAQAPHNAILVGREGQRAFLMEALDHNAGPGAYLITGHRGAGKTSFLRACIDEHRRNVYARFLSRRVGRAFLWDRLGLTLLALFASAGIVLLSEFLDLAIGTGAAPGESGDDAASEDSSPSWLLASILTLLATLPLIHGYRALSLAILPWTSASKQRQRRLITLLTYASLLLIGLYTSIVASTPATAVAVTLVGTCATAFCTRFTGAWFGGGERTKGAARVAMAVSLGALTAGVAYHAVYLWYPLESRSPLELLGVALPFFVLRERRPRGAGQLAYLTLGLPLAILLRDGPVSTLIVGVEYAWPFVAMAIIYYCATLGVRTAPKSTGVPGPAVTPQDWDRASGVLVVKAMTAVLLGAQLLRPVLMLAPWASDFGTSSSPTVDQGQIHWTLSIFATLVAIYALESDWIVARFHNLRRGASLDEGASHADVRIAYKQAEHTLPWTVMRTWTPLIVVHVNLGSDRLPYADIVRAMLSALREKYAESLVSLRSGFTLSLYAIVGFALVALTTAIGNRQFSPRAAPKPGDVLSAVERGRACEILANPNLQIPEYFAYPPAIRLLCGSPAVDAASKASRSELLQLLYYDIIHTSSQSRVDAQHTLACKFLLPCDTRDHVAYADPHDPHEPSGPKVLHFCFYHAVILLVLLLILRLLAWLSPLIPYRRNLAKLDSVIDRISSKRTAIPPGAFTGIASIANAILGRTQVQSKEIDREDARAVEASFISTIESLQSHALLLLGARGRALTLPAPDLVFVCDELDKVGSRLEHSPTALEAPVTSATDGDRTRAMAVKNLLAEMKNLLSSTQARFLFVGGRDLHDEWVADRTARLPLLSSIFRAELYLPSLLADMPRLGKGDWCTRVREYVRAEWVRAEHAQAAFSLELERPRVLERTQDDEPATFYPTTPEPGSDGKLPEVFHFAGAAALRDSYLDLVDERSAAQVPAGGRSGGQPATAALFEDAYRYLAYRSVGNAKELRDIFENLIRPTSRLFAKHLAPCGPEHSLNLSEAVRFRMQLVSDVYGTLHAGFFDRYGYRDDKFVVSLFHVADYLLRFHGRAFSWSNLERVDELVHIHRAHDQRRILEELVREWTGRYLLEIPNGMYGFRFRSSFAREIEYISRQSEDEMAALNFTLDEAEPMKALHAAKLARMAGSPTPDALAALGELHEFDEEYSLARSYYVRAIGCMDGGGRGDLLTKVHRVRLTLQLGMTFEREHDYERAALEYREARKLSYDILNSLRWEAIDRSMFAQLGIVHQASFASAWLLEKIPIDRGAGVRAINDELPQLLRALPTGGGLEIALIRSALSSKAGDLAFFRGAADAGADSDAGAKHYQNALRVLAESAPRSGSAPRLLGAIGSALCDLAEAVLSTAKVEEIVAGGSIAHVNDYQAKPAAWQEWGKFSVVEFWNKVGPVPEVSEGNDDLQKLLGSLYCAQAGAQALKQCGRIEDAAREYMQISDMSAQFLWWGTIVTKLGASDEHVAAPPFWNHVLDLTLECMEASRDLFRSCRGTRTSADQGVSPSGYHIGDVYPVQLAIAACSVGLAAHSSRWTSQRIGRMNELLRGMCGGEEITASGRVEQLQARLKDLYLRHAFPVLGRLHALKILTECIVLNGSGEPGDLCSQARELELLAMRYNAPRYFSYVSIGTSLALVWRAIYRTHANPEVDSMTPFEDLRRRAAALLDSESGPPLDTRDLYYLYDELNDRELHFNHALQRLGNSIAGRVKGWLNEHE